MASRGIGGMKGRLSACVSTGAGKIAGSALVRRAKALRLRSARHADVFRGIGARCHEDVKALLEGLVVLSRGLLWSAHDRRNALIDFKDCSTAIRFGCGQVTHPRTFFSPCSVV